MSDASQTPDPHDQRAQRRAQWNYAFATNVPHNHALGVDVLDLSADGARFFLRHRAELCGPGGSALAHGVIATLLDGCSGAAVFAALPRLVPIATLDLRIDYLRPCPPGTDLTCVARCTHLTETVGHASAQVFATDPNAPVATAVGAFMLSTKLGQVNAGSGAAPGGPAGPRSGGTP